MINSRILFNTIVINAQSIISLIIALYTSRMLIDILGILDYGIFNVVAGVIALLSFLNNSMIISTQRYISLEIGKGNIIEVSSILSTSLILHIIIAGFVILIGEIIGIQVITKYINIPLNKKETASILFHLIIISFSINIITVPFQAVINSYENMMITSLMSIANSLLQLIGIIIIPKMHTNNMIAYGTIILLTAILSILAYVIIVKIKYNDIKISLQKDIKKYKELSVFAFWNITSSFGMLCKNQGLIIVLNVFCGPIVNAAYGIANQINSAITNMSQSIVKSINPQIIKAYSINDTYKAIKLGILSIKISFMILSLMAIPLIFETEYILNMWLRKVPEGTILFCQIIIVNSLIEVFSYPIMTMVQATGKIKNYQITNTIILLLNIPLSITILYLTRIPQFIYIGVIGLSILNLFSRLYYIKQLYKVQYNEWVKYVLVKISFPVIMSLILAIIINNGIKMSLFRLVIISLSTIICLIITTWCIALEEEEKVHIRNINIL